MNINNRTYINKQSFSTAIIKRGYNVPIYRIIPIDSLFQILKNRQVWIGQTKVWEDVYENFLTKVIQIWGKVPTSNYGFIYNFYGQSWTLQKESDALWRIYSQNQNSVRIKSTIPKVIDLSTNNNDLENSTIRNSDIGQVKYLSKAKIKEWIVDKQMAKPLFAIPDFTESLFIKRSEFKHEKEVRLVIFKNSDYEEESKGLIPRFIKFDVDPNYLIDEVTFDPRISDEEFQTNMTILEKLGFKNKLNKSTLYGFDIPPIQM